MNIYIPISEPSNRYLHWQVIIKSQYLIAETRVIFYRIFITKIRLVSN